MCLGRFETAVEAAVAYARYCEAEGRTPRGSGQGVVEMESDDGVEEEERFSTGSPQAPLSLVENGLDPA